MLDTLAEIRERRDAVAELERSLLELHQVFLDMAVLVEAQGEMIDNIEAQVRGWLVVWWGGLGGGFGGGLVGGWWLGLGCRLSVSRREFWGSERASQAQVLGF